MSAIGDAPGAEAAPPIPTLLEPAGGVPELCRTVAGLADLSERFAAGSGPVAIDAERASGHRYGQRAFLIQAKRQGSGIALIDPEAIGRLDQFAAAITGAEWVLHSATQDLPCLADLGLRPARLFDTELAARLLNLPRVGLASLTESLLGWHLAKGHSAADWSIRPLPSDYLRYAALDVELLLQLRDTLQQRLAEIGKWHWASQEFEALLDWRPQVHPEPWRRTAGSSRLREGSQLAVLRALWVARDHLARNQDIAPGRVLPDQVLVAAAEAMPAGRAELAALPGFKRQQRRIGLWWQAVAEARALPVADLPPVRPSLSGPPPPRSWAAREPVAAQRFGRARQVVLAVAAEHDLPPEVLISPDAVRRLAWAPPHPADRESVAAFLAERGVRSWQVQLVSPGLAEALANGAGYTAGTTGGGPGQPFATRE